MLPKKIKIPNKILKDKQYNAISDYLSNKYGYCINSFCLKNNLAIKIDWDISK